MKCPHWSVCLRYAMSGAGDDTLCNNSSCGLTWVNDKNKAEHARHMRENNKGRMRRPRRKEVIK